MRENSSTLFRARTFARIAAGAALIAVSLSSQAQTTLTRDQEVWIPGKGLMHRIPIVRTSGGHGLVPTPMAASDNVPCADTEFVGTPSNGPGTAALVSRHKYCQEYVSGKENISVDLMKRTSTSQYEYYRPGIAAWEIRTVEVGKITLRARVHAFGPVGGLSKSHKIDVSAVGFEFDTSFPAHLRSGVFVKLDADPMVITYNDSDIQGFNIGAVGTFNSIRLDASNPSGSTGQFDVVVSWTYPGTDPSKDLVRFVANVPRFSYTINDTPRHGTTDKFYVYVGNGATAYLHNQMIRCDKKVASGDSLTLREGCILEEASPIMTMSKSGSGGEAAAHIEQAQTTFDGYKTLKSPGVFKAAAGIRAVADENGGVQFMGLVRGQPGDSKLNRDATCDLAGSLINVRPFVPSASCPTRTTSTCSCDEYPFATTQNGGAYNPDGTSAKYILKSHNQSGGGQLTAFFNNDRVFRGEKFWVRIVP